MQFETFLAGALLVCAYGFLQSRAAVFPGTSGQRDNLSKRGTVDARKQDEWFQQLLTWEFTTIKTLDGSKFELELKAEEFQLISALMSRDGRTFSEDEIFDLIRLGNKYIPKGYPLAVIVELGAKVMVIDGESLSDKNPDGIQGQIINLIRTGYLPVQFDDDEIVFEGWDATLDIRISALYALLFVSARYPQLRIKNHRILPIEAEIIQSSIKSHLTSIAFENCEFKFNKEHVILFNLSSLINLTHFECSNCEMDDLMTMLETIQPGNLVKLTITDCNMEERMQERFMQFLLQHSRLQYLTITKNSVKINFPKVTGYVLELKQLRHLDLTGTADIESFVQRLQNCKELTNLSYLNLMCCGYDSQNYWTFFSGLSKMPNLQFLGLFWGLDKCQTILVIPYRLSQLKELSYYNCADTSNLSKLLVELEKLPPGIKISSRLCPFSICHAPTIQYFKTVDCSELDLYTISLLPMGLTFDAVTKLTVKLEHFYDGETIDKYVNFFKKFPKLEFLAVEITEKCNLNYLKVLLGDSIVTLDLMLGDSFNKWKKLGEIIQNCKASTFSLSASGLNPENLPVLINESNTNFWGNLTHLELGKIPKDTIINILNNVEMPKLQSLIIMPPLWFWETSISFKLGSIRKLKLKVALHSILAVEAFGNFLRCFPKLVILEVILMNGSLCNFDIYKTFSNIRELKINVLS